MKGYEMILQDENHIHLFIIGNIVAFVALLAVKTLSVSLQNGFKFWGWYHYGIALLIYFILNNGTINC
jgi:undecaprenyl-diphosphatase